MKNKMKLGLLTAVASVILALPVAASAATSRGEPLPTNPRIEVINQVPQVITQVPLPLYLGTVNLHPSIGEIYQIETKLPVWMFNNVSSINLLGESSDVFASLKCDGGSAIIFFTSENVVSKSTVHYYVHTYDGKYGYYIVNVFPSI